MKCKQPYISGKTLKEMLWQIEELYTNHIAVKVKTKKTEFEKTFTELKKDAGTLQNYFSKLLEPNSNCAVLGELGYEWIITFFGVTSSGNTLVPVDTNLMGTKLVERIEEADSRLVIYDEKYRKEADEIKMAKLPGVIFLSYTEIMNIIEEERPWLDIPLSENERAMIVYTSGTTGKHKGVVLSHGNITEDIRLCHSLGPDIGPTQYTVPVLPPYHMYSITVGVVSPLGSGLTLGFCGGVKHFSKALQYFKPTFLVLVPMVVESFNNRIEMELENRNLNKKFDMLVKVSRFLRMFHIDIRRQLFKSIIDQFGGNLKSIMVGGAYVRPELVKRFEDIGIQIQVGYGATECSPLICGNSGEKSGRRLKSIGKINTGRSCEIKLVNEEIWVRGPIVMQGYYKDPEETRKSFQDGWYKTGDLGKLDKDNFLYLTGRIKNLIIRGDGNNVSPEELENEIMKESIVSNCFVTLKKNNGKEILVAIIYPDTDYLKENGKESCQKRLEAAISALNQTLPAYKKIQAVELVEKEFETTSLGKVKRYLYEE